MANNRIYFANQQVAFRKDGDASANAWIGAHGVQSVAVTTTFNLDQAFELGQLEIYENIEGVPDVEMSLTKVLDGYPLLYHLASNGTNSSPTLAGRSASKCLVALGVWQDTQDNASGTPVQQMEASGLFSSALTYNFPLEDNFSEDITLVGNDKVWLDMDNAGQGINCTNPPWAVKVATGIFPTGGDAPKAGTTGGGVNRRENLAFAASSSQMMGSEGIDYTRLPSDIPGTNVSGWMSARNASNFAHIQNISVSTDLGREELFELGTRQPYARVVTFPIEVTCSIDVLSVSGDLVDALSDGCSTSTDACTGIVDNLSNQTIRIVTCEGTHVFLGTKNKLASVNYGGGDAGGGNVTSTFNYTTFNDCTVMHPQDPNANITWASRSTYLQ